MEQYAIFVIIIIVAFLYSSVGHGGASGYLGIMALFGMSPLIMKPSALLLNVMVSAIATYQFHKGGHFKRELFIPFILLSVPFAFLGAKIELSYPLYKIILGICLLISVARMLSAGFFNSAKSGKNMPWAPAIAIGAAIGLISGMIGIGGGILLSPLLLLFRWADLKESAAVAAPFILVNSLSGMAGMWSSGLNLSPEIILWVIAAVAGGTIGSYWGSRKFNVIELKYALSVVLVIAAVKLFIS